ncbi:hypothetical protein EMCG_04660 [[Emmonsia] crescens]|uniref:Peptidase C13 family protein n=1 Tax=[Emmonsia] crescens TaxID=73230 RepID=A0A0G2J782_9EURO|nr:hypothetical protein EMCG_04660 [Emmonsia crescens UAMH 3008]
MPVDRVQGRKEALVNMAFKTSCPPDVSAKSRVVAVCGVTNYENGAAQNENGESYTDIKTEAQVWLTTEEPKDLVMKNLRVVPRTILLERFLSTLHEQAILAARNDEQLIVFVFGHGDPSTHGVHIGGECKKPQDIPRLTMEQSKRALPPGVKVTLFTTACYSGNWLVQPNTNQATFLNLTGVPGAGIDEQTQSWSFSRNAGRACGSSIASAIVQSVIAIDEERDATGDILTHPTYMGLALRISETVSKIHSMAEEQCIHFSAQGDEWEAHFGKRTRFPLVRFKEAWESLRSLPPSGVQLGDHSNQGGAIS